MKTLQLFAAAALFALLMNPVAIAEDDDAAQVESTITLESNGAEPRRTLRYAPTAGARVDVEMSLDIEMESIMGAMTFPTIIVDGEMEILKVDKNKDFTTQLEFVDMKTQGEDTTGMGAMIAGSLDGMKGMKLETLLSCRGALLDVSFKKDALSDPTAKQMFDTLKETARNTATQLPEDPVGIGAKWTVDQDVTASEITIHLETSYEVVGLDGDIVKLKIVVKQTAKQQTIDHPMGMRMEIKKLEGSGSGTTTIDLSMGVTTESDMSLVTDTTMAVDMGVDQPQDIEQKMTLATKMSATPIAVTAGADEEK